MIYPADMELLLVYPVESFPKHEYSIERDTILVSDDSADFALDDAIQLANELSRVK
jgi:hypothetical protein